ncbi:MAG: glucose-6-phosphate dehydrogenase [Spirochaetia bacterium]
MKNNPLLWGLEKSKSTAPFAFYIFGVTGDLTRSKLVPALFSLFLKGNISRFKIIGFARREWTKEYLMEKGSEMIADFPDSDEVKQAFLEKMDYIQSTFESEKGYKEIEAYSGEFENKIYYLSTPPAAYDTIIEKLGEFGLADEGKGYTRIVVEKPFGRDLQSAGELNRKLLKYFREEQIYRIDHYLGKETVQNIMLLRFGNGIFEPIWNSQYVDHIQITVAEKSGIGTRGNYYEKSGALRDIIQNHMLQLLSLTAMEPPNDLSADALRDEKVKVIKSLHPVTGEDVERLTVRGQYGEGIVDGREVPGYRQENDVAEDSMTETYAALRVTLDSWRWAGVPIFLRAGKRLARKATEIAVSFKEPPLAIFGQKKPFHNGNTLIINIQPEEGITLNFNAKVPGYAIRMQPVNMDFTYGTSFGETTPEAYERLLLDAMTGDSTLYARGDEIEAAWAFLSGIMTWWENDEREPHIYTPGSAGPTEAADLFDKAGRRWRKI